MPLPILYIIVPCFNEEEVLPVSSALLLDELQTLAENGLVDVDGSRILFVDDGSSDTTWAIIDDLATRDGRCLGLRLSRNRGHQNALIAGMEEARGNCDIAITIDADGQDDESVMAAMVEAYANGCDVVYGVRRNRDSDTAFKRVTARWFYRLMSAMGCEIVSEHADFRLMSARVLDALAEYEEVNLFLRGMVPLVGFSSTSVAYDRRARLAGRSRYPISNMLSLAWEGITSLSVRPLRIATALGIVISALSFVGIIWVVVTKLMGNAIAGWASMTAIQLFIAGIQLIVLGIIGEYVGKTYLEAKRRPRYFVSERSGSPAETHVDAERPNGQ